MRETRTNLIAGETVYAIDDPSPGLITKQNSLIRIQLLFTNPPTMLVKYGYYGSWDKSDGSLDKANHLNHGVDTPDDTVYLTKTDSDVTEFLELTSPLAYAIEATRAKMRIRFRATSTTPYVKLNLTDENENLLCYWMSNAYPAAANTWEVVESIVEVTAPFTEAILIDGTILAELSCGSNSADTVDVSEIEIVLLP